MEENFRETAKSGDELLNNEDGTRMRAPVPVWNQPSNPPFVPINSIPKRRPIGAVATVMVSSDALATGGVGKIQKEVATDGEDATEMEQSHANNPYDLKAVAGSTVTASYPFHGEACLQQLSFTVSPSAGLVWRLRAYTTI